MQVFDENYVAFIRCDGELSSAYGIDICIFCLNTSSGDGFYFFEVEEGVLVIGCIVRGTTITLLYFKLMWAK